MVQLITLRLLDGGTNHGGATPFPWIHVADEYRLNFNDELRRHSKLAILFNRKGAGP
jgi:hypothetical protein